MASDTYTPNYNLTKPAIGGDTNTWGTLLNGNFDTIDAGMAALVKLDGSRPMTGSLTLNTPAQANWLAVLWQLAGKNQWSLQANGNADFSLSRYKADGTWDSDLVVFPHLGSSNPITFSTNVYANGAFSVPNGGSLMGKNTGGANIKLVGIGADNNVDIQNGGASIRFINQAYNAVLLNCDNGGNVSTLGNSGAFSDERLKTDWADLPGDFIERLAGVRHGTFTRIDTGARQAGVGAQSLAKLLPEAVMDVDGILSVAYGNAALVAAVELAQAVVELRAELRSLRGDAK